MKCRNYSMTITAIVLLEFIAGNPAHGQYIQQGVKLLGAGVVGAAGRGSSVAVSQHGNAALVGGPGDNNRTGAMWFYTRTNGVWTIGGTKIVPSGAAVGHFFGVSVGLSGDGLTAIGGSAGEGAWIFSRSGSVWTEQGHLVNPLLPNGETVGGIVAISGDGTTAMVSGTSAILTGTGELIPEAVWVFSKSGNLWTQQGPPILADSGHFPINISLSYDGNTAAVSSEDDGLFAWSPQHVYRKVFRVFTRSNGIWSQQGPRLTLDWQFQYNNSSSTGLSMSSDGNTVVIGDPSDALDASTGNGTGATFVFTRKAGVWTQEAKLVGTGGIGPYLAQGYAVAIAGDSSKIIVGGYGDDLTVGLGESVGASWIFAKSGGVWSQVGDKLVGSGAIGRPSQGTAVAFSKDGTTAIVGGPGDNNNYGASWIFVEAPLAVIRPVTSEVVLAGEPYDIQWQTTGIDSIKIGYSLDSGKTYQDVVSSIAANQNHYTWIFPDTLSTRCKVRISDVADSTTSALSGRFRLKGYVLTRINSSGDYEAFSTEKHGWSFKNDSLSMWPSSWWSQFDYAHGNDPNTGKPYFLPFLRQSAVTAPSDYSDWPLFVDAFQKQYCFKFGGWVTTKALEFWVSNTRREFKGTCSGFAISSLIAFTNPEALRDSFPTIGSFDNLRQLPLNDERRKIINQLSWHQSDAEHERNAMQQKTATPRQTLAQLKSMLHAEHPDPGFLGMLIPRLSIAHAIDAFKLTIEDRALGRYWLKVYDSNEPTATGKSFLIDSSANTWSANPTLTFSDGLFLEDPVSTYLRHPRLPGTNGTVTAAQSRMSSQLSGEHPAGTATAGELYVFTSPRASTAITNANGESIGFADSIIIDAMPGAMPIVPVTGSYAPPVGYVVPNGTYTARLGSFGDSVAYCRIFGDSASYCYGRSDATPSQSDNVRLADGFSIGNGDNALKHMNFRTIVPRDSIELTFDINNVSASPGDSLKLRELMHSDLLIANYGVGKTYDLDLYLGSPTRAGRFSHPSVPLNSNSSHRIVPPWNDLATQPVKILIDSHNSGTFDDSIFVSNRTTGTGGLLSPEMPGEFRLDQNYPNPFNPSTTIRYGLPHKTAVQLTVYNTLGQSVSTLVNGEQEAGYHEVKFEGSGLSSGVYFYRLRAGDFVETKRLLLLR